MNKISIGSEVFFVTQSKVMKGRCSAIQLDEKDNVVYTIRIVENSDYFKRSREFLVNEDNVFVNENEALESIKYEKVNALVDIVKRQHLSKELISVLCNKLADIE